MKRVGEELKIRAREADLYKFIQKYYPDTVIDRNNGTLTCKQDSTITIYSGYGGGYYKHSGSESGEAGNAIDYLMRYLEYKDKFQEAVIALLEFAPTTEKLDDKGKFKRTNDKYPLAEYIIGRPDEDEKLYELKVPERTIGKFQHVYAYLTKVCNIQATVVLRMFKEKLLFQDVNNNCVFMSAHCNFAEIIGTNTVCDNEYRGVVGNGYWAFNANPLNTKVYICKSAVDAVLHYCINGDEDATYVSVGGCTKPKPFVSIRNDTRLGSGEIILCLEENDIGKDTLCRLQSIVADKDMSNETNELKEDVPNEEGPAEIERAEEDEELSQDIIDEFIEFYCNNNFEVYDAYNKFITIKNYRPTINQIIILISEAKKIIKAS